MSEGFGKREIQSKVHHDIAPTGHDVKLFRDMSSLGSTLSTTKFIASANLI